MFVDYLMPIGIACLGGVLMLVFLKNRKPPVQDTPFAIEEEIPVNAQPYIIFAGGKTIAVDTAEQTYGVPYAGHAFWRRAYNGTIHYKINNVFTNQTIELKPLVDGVNLVEPKNVDKTGGRVIYYCNVDATNRICEWDYTVADKYVTQMSEITIAHAEYRAREKLEKLLQKKSVYDNPNSFQLSSGERP